MKNSTCCDALVIGQRCDSCKEVNEGYTTCECRHISAGEWDISNCQVHDAPETVDVGDADRGSVMVEVHYDEYDYQRAREDDMQEADITNSEPF